MWFTRAFDVWFSLQIHKAFPPWPAGGLSSFLPHHFQITGMRKPELWHESARMAWGSGCAQHSPKAEEGRTDAREQALCVSVVQTLFGMTAARFCAGRAVGVQWWRDLLHCLVLVRLIWFCCCFSGKYFRSNCKSSACVLEVVSEIWLSLHQAGRKFTHVNIVKPMQNWGKEIWDTKNSSNPCQCFGKGCRFITACLEKASPRGSPGPLAPPWVSGPETQRISEVSEGWQFAYTAHVCVCSRGKPAQQEDTCGCFWRKAYLCLTL